MNIKIFSIFPTFFTQPPQHTDFMVGVIQSDTTKLPAPTGETRDKLDLILQLSHLTGYIEQRVDMPALSAQRKMLRRLSVNPNQYVGSNEQNWVDAVEGKKFEFNDLLSVINKRVGLDHQYCIESYDLEKIASNDIFIRQGYKSENAWVNDTCISLGHVPVFSTKEKAFGSPFVPFNLAPIDSQTTQILTLIFSMEYATSHNIHDLDVFSKNLENIIKGYENKANMTTVRSLILSGFPHMLNLNSIDSKPLKIYVDINPATQTNFNP